MFSQRRDFLLGMIERLVQGVLDHVREALGGETSKINELEHECERAMENEFAELHRRVRALTSRSAGSVIRPVSKLRDYAMLLGALALARASRCRPRRGRRLIRRSREGSQ